MQLAKTPKKNPRERATCCINALDLFAVYEAVVEATNIFGTSSSKAFNFTRNIQVRPDPPRSLKAHAEGYGEISLEWATIGWTSFKFIIYYSTQGDQRNKTIITGTSGQNYYRITGLKPYTKYTIYLAAINNIFNEIGIPAGPVTIVTREENPSRAPEISDWNSVIYPENTKLRNVTVRWNLPPKDSWNGKITKYILQYRRIPHLKDIETHSLGQYKVIYNTSTNKGKLVGLRVDSAYNLDMQMCNLAGCGGIGDRVMIKAIIEPFKEQIQRENFQSMVILCAAVVTILVIVLAVFVLFFKYKRTQYVESSKHFPPFYVKDNGDAVKV